MNSENSLKNFVEEDFFNAIDVDMNGESSSKAHACGMGPPKTLPVKGRTEKRRASGEKRDYPYHSVMVGREGDSPLERGSMTNVFKAARTPRRHSAHASISPAYVNHFAQPFVSAGMDFTAQAHTSFQQPNASLGLVEPGFAEQNPAEQNGRRVTRRSSMPAAFGVGSDSLVADSMDGVSWSSHSIFHSLAEVAAVVPDDAPITVPSCAETGEDIPSSGDMRQIMRRRVSFPSGSSIEPESKTQEEEATHMASVHPDIMSHPAFEPTPIAPVTQEPMAISYVPCESLDSTENYDTRQVYDFEPTPIAQVGQAAISTAPAEVYPSKQQNHTTSIDAFTPVDPLCYEHAEGPSATTVLSNNLCGPNLTAQGEINSNLRSFMSKSQETAKQLQDWDTEHGLPRSHSQTMIKTARSRTQLLEGKILKKWDGSPLISFEQGPDGSVVVNAGPKKRSKHKAERRASL